MTDTVESSKSYNKDSTRPRANGRRNGSRRFKTKYKECFNCRKLGHMLADCPQLKNVEDDKKDDGLTKHDICYCCGSTEHTSKNCKKKNKSFKFASCFICGESGHISRECEKNKSGIYPKGGGCLLCQGTDHLVRDCPTKKKKKNNERKEVKPKIKMSSIFDNPDAEDFNEYLPTVVKKPKILKIK